jgi:hypothetical protein
MARERNYDDGYAPYRRQADNGLGWIMVILMGIAVVAFVIFLYPDIAGAPSAPERAVGGQAPKDIRGVFSGSDTRVNAPPVATPIPGIAQSTEEAEQMYQEAIQQAAPPLPLNSVGQPVISQEQQAQQSLSLQLAEQEGAVAVDAQLAAQRATADAEALSRPPDVSYEDAKALLGRDPCSVPRANPHTCMNGLYKPTPVN